MENLENFWHTFLEVQCFSLRKTATQRAEWHFYASIKGVMGVLQGLQPLRDR